MSYTLGLDLGTTWTIAATYDGHATTVFSHPSGETAIPSVVAIDEQGSFLVGEPADRHALSNPSAVAREFKRRFGDTTPLLLRGSPLSAAELVLRLVSHVVDTASAQIGEQPGSLVVTHPASWGGYKAGLLAETLQSGALPPCRLLPEPIAVARHFNNDGHFSEGARAAVYDLGGSTFDLTIVELGAEDWHVIGRPGGIERIGGVDFDTALFHHVLETADIDLDRWDPEDPATQLSVSGLRASCTAAKHLLSSEAEAMIAVSLPTLETTVQVSRATFESPIGPLVTRTLDEFDLVLQQNSLVYDQIDEILVSGGSSRVPLVQQRLASHTARPFRVATDGRFATAYGAATSAPVVEPRPESKPLPAPVVETLGTNFPTVPDMAGEPAPDFLRRTIAVEPALPKPEAAPPQPKPEPAPSLAVPAPTATQAPAAEAHAPTQPLPAMVDEQPVASPIAPADYRPPKRSKIPIVVTLVVLAVAALGALVVVQNNRSGTTESNDSTTTVANGETTVFTVETSVGTLTTVPATNETANQADFGDCTVDQQPQPGTAYRVVFIPETDTDGGLNARAEPRVGATIVTVFKSLSPVKGIGNHCAIDNAGRAWWGTTSPGTLVWVSAAFLEELPN